MTKQSSRALAICLFLVFFAFVGISFANSDGEATDDADASDSDDHVLVLNQDSFPAAISEHEFILVEFYAPWCGHCKRLEPEYAEAARQLNEEGSNIKLAKVDATQNQILAESQGVRGFPTIKFFRHGYPIEYDGGRIASDIVAWLKKRSGEPVSILNEQNITSFIDSNDVALVAFFEDAESSSAKLYRQLALVFHEIPFAVVSDKSLIELDGSGVVLFKKFDEKKAVLNGEFTEEQFSLFVKDKSTPLLNYFTGSPKIFQTEIRSHLFYFGNKDDENHAATEALLRETAQSFRGQLIFSFVDVQSPLTQRVCDFFQVSKDTAPAVYAFNLTEDGLNKYRPETYPADSESLKTFISDFFAGLLTPFLKSEEPVEYEGKGVRVLVGKDHDGVVADPSKIVFVEYYAPWCGHCKNLAPIWEQLAEHFAGNDEVLIAKFDATANEVQSVNVQGFPTLYLYTKDDNMIAYNGERTLEELVKFVQSVLDGTYVPEEFGEGDEDYAELEDEEVHEDEDEDGEHEDDEEVHDDEEEHDDHHDDEEHEEL